MWTCGSTCRWWKFRGMWGAGRAGGPRLRSHRPWDVCLPVSERRAVGRSGERPPTTANHVTAVSAAGWGNACSQVIKHRFHQAFQLPCRLGGAFTSFFLSAASVNSWPSFSRRGAASGVCGHNSVVCSPTSPVGVGWWSSAARPFALSPHRGGVGLWWIKLIKCHF